MFIIVNEGMLYEKRMGAPNDVGNYLTDIVQDALIKHNMTTYTSSFLFNLRVRTNFKVYISYKMIILFDIP